MNLEQTLKERLDASRLNAIPVKELAASESKLLLTHFLALGPEDRFLRFGNPLSDSVIETYVLGIDFTHDRVFGVFNERLELDAVAHFAHLPVSALTGPASAEFGLSVSSGARGRGIGSALFARALTHARNQKITVLYMHCLTQNKAMMHIAKKAGMQISMAYGEADAYLTLPPPDAASRVSEAMHDQIALFDYAMKSQLAGARKLWPFQALPLLESRES